MPFDFKKVLGHADTFIQLAGMARDQIADRINHELEKQLISERTLKEDAFMELLHLKEDLRSARAEIENERRWRQEAEDALELAQRRDLPLKLLHAGQEDSNAFRPSKAAFSLRSGHTRYQIGEPFNGALTSRHRN